MTHYVVRLSKAKSYNFHFHKNDVTCVLVQINGLLGFSQQLVGKAFFLSIISIINTFCIKLKDIAIGNVSDFQEV